jgi:hypothetical protein
LTYQALAQTKADEDVRHEDAKRTEATKVVVGKHAAEDGRGVADKSKDIAQVGRRRLA